MDKGYLILNYQNKNIDFKNLFLDKQNAIIYLNQLNENIYKLNLTYLKTKLNKTKKIKKQEKLKIVIEDYQNLREKANEAVKQGLPLYLQPSFKTKYLKHTEYYITEIQLKKVNNEDQKTE
jgi:hypothetical protein